MAPLAYQKKLAGYAPDCVVVYMRRTKIIRTLQATVETEPAKTKFLQRVKFKRLILNKLTCCRLCSSCFYEKNKSFECQR